MHDEPPPHGYHLSPEMHDVLRGPVPSSALEWVETETGEAVIDQRPLDGGTSSAIHRLVLRAPGGATRDVVLRRFVRDWVLEEPWAPGNEALALTLLARQSRIPVPELLAADPDGARTGTPAVLMSSVPGEVVWQPTDLEGWLQRLAEQLPAIHAIPVDPRLATWAPYEPGPGVPPAWTAHPRAWATAVELWEGGPPPGDRVFLHRDYHPGNVLWTGSAVTGIVDWVSACAGPPEEDVAHCRANLAGGFGLDVADRFLRIWLDITGRDGYDPYYDLTTVVSFGNKDPDPRLDAFVAAAAAARR